MTNANQILICFINIFFDINKFGIWRQKPQSRPAADLGILKSNVVELVGSMPFPLVLACFAKFSNCTIYFQYCAIIILIINSKIHILFIIRFAPFTYLPLIFCVRRIQD